MSGSDKGGNTPNARNNPVQASKPAPREVNTQPAKPAAKPAAPSTPKPAPTTKPKPAASRAVQTNQKNPKAVPQKSLDQRVADALKSSGLKPRLEEKDLTYGIKKSPRSDANLLEQLHDARQQKDITESASTAQGMGDVLLTHSKSKSKQPLDPQVRETLARKAGSYDDHVQRVPRAGSAYTGSAQPGSSKTEAPQKKGTSNPKKTVKDPPGHKPKALDGPVQPPKSSNKRDNRPSGRSR